MDRLKSDELSGLLSKENFSGNLIAFWNSNQEDLTTFNNAKNEKKTALSIMICSKAEKAVRQFIEKHTLTDAVKTEAKKSAFERCAYASIWNSLPAYQAEII